jgi:hypothetical protein
MNNAITIAIFTINFDMKYHLFKENAEEAVEICNSIK